MQWTIRFIRSGYVFCDSTITSWKTVLSRVTKRLNRDGLKPIWDTLHLPYTNVTIKVAYFQASAIFADLLSCGHLNVDANYIYSMAIGIQTMIHMRFPVETWSVIWKRGDHTSKPTTPYARIQTTCCLCVLWQLTRQCMTSVDMGVCHWNPLHCSTEWCKIWCLDEAWGNACFRLHSSLEPWSSACRTWGSLWTCCKYSSSNVNKMYQRDMKN